LNQNQQECHDKMGASATTIPCVTHPTIAHPARNASTPLAFIIFCRFSKFLMTAPDFGGLSFIFKQSLFIE
jgi:hypothetical protein